ncbi:hypothetical protein EV653_5644 [Kribbella pratensis]|uniref:Uncharacterized protein n=1 Tax=Kribbella pratensis TaxID=2512112 RepID=A0A4R8BX08_9ACTN|nr:hypothetical protein EV653_5644 [Kribbella pratensis]
MRFIGRYDGDHQRSASYLYGIWDNARSEWAARGLPGPEAGLQAAMLSLRYSRLAERPDRDARWLAPTVHVELTVSPTLTEVALLRMWARETDGWYGYVTYLERHPLSSGRWAHASALKPLLVDDIETFSRQRTARQSDRP